MLMQEPFYFLFGFHNSSGTKNVTFSGIELNTTNLLS